MKPLRAAGVLVLGILSMACQDPGSDDCDRGQILDPLSGYCIAAPVDAGSRDGRASDAARAEASTDAGACDAALSKFGDTCTATTDCHCPTDYCAVMPAATTGFCTRTGCDVDPTICPAKWTCFDLGAFQTGLPHICYQ